MRLKYEWRVTFRDGEVLDEHNPQTGQSRPWTEAFKKPIALVQLVEAATGEIPVTVHLKPGQKPITRRRVAIPMSIGGTIKPAGPRTTVWLMGWHQKVDGRNVQQVFFVHADGKIEVIDRWDENSRLYYAVKLLPEEKLWSK